MAYKDAGEHQIKLANAFELVEKFQERRAQGHATQEETYQKYLILGWRDLDTDEFFYITLWAVKESLSDLDVLLKEGRILEDGSLLLPGFLTRVIKKEALDRMRVLKTMPWKEKLGHTQMEFREILRDLPGRQEFFNHP